MSFGQGVTPLEQLQEEEDRIEMAKEIERKFLLKGDAWKSLAKGTRYRQGYLNSVKERTVRVRTVGDKGFLTVKGITTGASERSTSIPFRCPMPRGC